MKNKIILFLSFLMLVMCLTGCFEQVVTDPGFNTSKTIIIVVGCGATLIIAIIIYVSIKLIKWISSYVKKFVSKNKWKFVKECSKRGRSFRIPQLLLNLIIGGYFYNFVI